MSVTTESNGRPESGDVAAGEHSRERTGVEPAQALRASKAFP